MLTLGNNSIIKDSNGLASTGTATVDMSDSIRQNDKKQFTMTHTKPLTAYQDTFNKTQPCNTNNILLHKFFLYFKKVSKSYKQIELYKRQLFEYFRQAKAKGGDIFTWVYHTLDITRIGENTVQNNGLHCTLSTSKNYTKKGYITIKDIQLFLINHKHFMSPDMLNRYYYKYNHGGIHTYIQKSHIDHHGHVSLTAPYTREYNRVKQGLMYEDIDEMIMPTSDYVLMGAVLTSYGSSKSLCLDARMQILQKQLALVLSTQICLLHQCYQQLQTLIYKNSMHVGGLLWRMIDQQHNNSIDFIKMSAISANQFGIQITKDQYLAFINWHFRSHTGLIKRDDFMCIFDLSNRDKRRKSVSNYQKFIQVDACRKRCLKQQQQKQRIDKIVSERIQFVAEANRNSCLKNQFVGHEKTKLKRQRSTSVGKAIKSKKTSENEGKKLLDGKLGYKNPNNLIKSSNLVED